MPTSLENVRGRIVSRLKTLDRVFDRYALDGPRMRIDRSAMQEGLISALWQSWCAFCRETIVASSMGATKTGIAITSPHLGRTEMEIAYIAQRLGQNRAVTSIRALATRRHEPTWGDLQIINRIATGISTSNQSQLLTAFGVATAINDLQLCRNASAHYNAEIVAELNAARVRYQNTRFVHPSDLVFWTDPATQDYLWKTWIEEIDLVSDLATR